MARKPKPKPSVTKFSGKRKDDRKDSHKGKDHGKDHGKDRDHKDAKKESRRAEPEERMESSRKADVRISAKHEPKGLVGRLAAAMDKNAPSVRSASSLRDDDGDEVEVRSSPKAANPRGGASWDDLSDLDVDDEPAKPAAKGKADAGPTVKHDGHGHGGKHGHDDEDDKFAGASSHGPARKGTAITIDDEPDTPLPPTKGKGGHGAGHSGGHAAVEPGVNVVTTGQNKFSMADIEALKAAIKIKGGTQVIDGINLDELKWDTEGLVPCVAQDRRTGAVLMVGWMNREVLESSLRSKNMSYWNKLHGKVQGMDESGRHQRLVTMKADCDKDALLAIVDQEGPACHNNGMGTCWSDQRGLALASYLGILDGQVAAAAKDASHDPKAAKLMAEPIQALKAFVDDANHLTKTLQGKTDDTSDVAAATLLYHMLVVLRVQGISLEKVVTELYGRHLGEQLTKGHK